MIRLRYIHYVLTLLFQIHFATSQFPDHADLQKVGEIIFDNEKYNVLKPTVHKISDHFKDFMRREIKNKNERVFIDENGFRHFWSGLGLKKNSLRKTDISMHEVNKNLQEKKEIVESISKLVKKGLKRPKTNSEEQHFEKAILRQATTAKPAETAKKVAITSFFCPFFGVIKMTSFLE